VRSGGLLWRLALPAVVVSGLGIGVARGQLVFAVLLAVALTAAWLLTGFSGVAAVCIAAIALGSASYPALKETGLEERWIALGTLAAWPLVSRRLPRLPASRLLLVGLGTFIGLALLSVAWSIDRALTLGRTGAFALLLFVALLAVPAHTQLPHERRALARALAALLVAGAVCALVLGVADPATSRTYGPLRGWLENSNTLGLWCAALAPCLLAVHSRRLAMAGGIAVAAAIVWSESRSAIFALSAVLLLLLPVSGWKRLGLAGLVGTVILVLALTPAREALRYTGLGKFSGSGDFIRSVTGARSEAWDVTARLVALEPLEGFGFGTGDRVFRLSGADKQFQYFEGNNPHNAYLQLLLELGIAGVIVFGAVLSSAFAEAWRLGRDPNRRPFLLMSIVLLVAAVVESILTSPGSAFSILFWLGLGVTLVGAAPAARRRQGPARVLLHATSLHPSHDGAHTILSNLIRQLPVAWPGARLTVTLPGGSPELGGADVEVIRLGSTRSGILRAFGDHVRLPPIVGRLRPDVVIGPNESVPSRLEAPLVIVAQNLVYHCPQVGPVADAPLRARLRSRLQFAFYRAQMPRTYERADAVVAVSPHAAELLAERAGLDPSRTTVVPEGADGLPLLPKQPASSPRQLVIVGTLAPYKRIEVALAALAELRASGDHQYELVLVGHSWPGQRESLEAAAEDAGVSELCRFLGPMAPDGIAELYSRAHASVALSSCESFGLPIVEAMRAGLPVVVADERWSADLVGNVAVRVDASDVNSVVAGIRSLEDERARGSAVRRQAAERFTWAATATGIAAVASRAAGLPGERAGNEHVGSPGREAPLPNLA
jgi:glycosyltransferase involved in cell wall biosynthesis/O-antigen ligase